MWSKNSVPLALVIEGSDELAMYVKRSGDLIVYKHGETFFAISLRNTLENITRNSITHANRCVEPNTPTDNG